MSSEDYVCGASFAASIINYGERREGFFVITYEIVA
jgi:hypothetical protein